MNRPGSVVLAALILLAGCGTFLPSDSGPTTSSVGTTASPGNTGGTTTDQLGGSSPPTSNSASPTVTPPRALRNPWKEATVSVALTTDEAVDNATRHRLFLHESIDFWNENAERYTPFSVKFELIEEPAMADVVVNATPTVARCGEERATTTFLYCSDSHDRIGSATNQSQLVISSRYNDTQTRIYYREAFAVLLGVENPLIVDGVREFEIVRLRDPWPESNPVVVNISNTVSTSRDFSPLIEAAIEYWESGDGARYRNYSVDFVLRPEAEDADVTIRIVDSLLKCGDDFAVDSDYTGCAPVYSGDFPAGSSSEILILSGYTNNTTSATLRHEFGHLHGRLHGQEPLPLMAPTFDAIRLPTPNVTEVEQPWIDNRLRVFIDISNVSSSQRAIWDDEIAVALDYISDGADGAVPTVVSFEIVENESKANVVIRAHENLESDIASTSERFGFDVDEDDALESYSLQRIQITTAASSRDVAYHVAYWLVRSWAHGDEIPESIDGENDDRASAP